MRVFLHPIRPGTKPEVLSPDLEYSAATTADNREVCRAMLFWAAISPFLTSTYGAAKV
jgi:hypothetical protein